VCTNFLQRMWSMILTFACSRWCGTSRIPGNRACSGGFHLGDGIPSSGTPCDGNRAPPYASPHVWARSLAGSTFCLRSVEIAPYLFLSPVFRWLPCSLHRCMAATAWASSLPSGHPKVSLTTAFPFVTATYNPQLQEKVYGDFTSFYVTITICTVLGAFLLNIALCCCSRYKKYWQDSNTGKYIIHFCFTKASRNNAIVIT
jgi:hypothetical protein